MTDRPERPGFRLPGPAPKEALDYFRGRDLRPGFSFRDVWLEEHAHAFTVAKAMEVDLLDDIRNEIDKAIAPGRTLRQFRKGLTPILRKRGWWGKKDRTDPKTGKTVRAQLGSPRRLRTIYRSNLRAARAAGQWARAQRTKKTHPYFLYELGPGKKHRDRHRAWAGTLLPVDDPWWDDHFPPNGWGCRCRVRQVSRAEAERRGGPTPRPPRNARTLTNRRSGMRFEVDEGLDPAWASNPGKRRAQILDDHLNAKLEAADQELAQAAVESIVRSPMLGEHLRKAEDYRRLKLAEETHVDGVRMPRTIKDRIGHLWIGVANDRAHEKIPPPLDTKFKRTRVVRLSPENAVKQVINHRDLEPEDYRRLPEVIQHGEIYVEDERHLIFFRESGGSLYQAVVKQTSNNQLYLKSFHRAESRHRKAVEKRARKPEMN